MSLFEFLKEKLKRKERAIREQTITNSVDQESSQVIVKPANWKAVKEAFGKVYPEQKETHRHLTAKPQKLDGTQPVLDSISVYNAGDYWHFVTHGLSDANNKKSSKFDAYNVEFTYRLKKYEDDSEEEIMFGTANLLQLLARLTVEENHIFLPNHFLYSEQIEGIDPNKTSILKGFICVADPKVPSIETPNGKIHFIEFVGVSNSELQTLSDEASVQNLYSKIQNGWTDFRRKSVI